MKNPPVMRVHRFSHILIPIMGFTEDVSRLTGIEKIWEDASDTAPSGSWVLDPQVWSADWKKIALAVERNSTEDARLMIVAHSWGVGWGARRLSDFLADMGREVKVIVSADGVYRSPLFPPCIPFNPLSILPFWRLRIPIPKSVRFVSAYRQTHGPARGHEFRVHPETSIEYHDLNVPHGETDDHPIFKEEALARWRALTRG